MPRGKAAAKTMRITPKDLTKDAHLHAEGKRCQMGFAIEVSAKTADFLIERELAYAAPDEMEDFFDEQYARLPKEFTPHAEVAQEQGVMTASDV